MVQSPVPDSTRCRSRRSTRFIALFRTLSGWKTAKNLWSGRAEDAVARGRVGAQRERPHGLRRVRAPHRSSSSPSSAASSSAPTRDDPMLDVLSRRGGEHEDKQLARYRAEGETVVEIPGDLRHPRPHSRKREAQTPRRHARRRRRHLPGHLLRRPLARPRRLPPQASTRPSPHLGAWSYEVADTKLARRVKAAALLQMCALLRARRAPAGHRPAADARHHRRRRTAHRSSSPTTPPTTAR